MISIEVLLGLFQASRRLRRLFSYLNFSIGSPSFDASGARLGRPHSRPGRGCARRRFMNSWRGRSSEICSELACALTHASSLLHLIFTRVGHVKDESRVRVMAAVISKSQPAGAPDRTSAEEAGSTKKEESRDLLNCHKAKHVALVLTLREEAVKSHGLQCT